MSVIGGPVVNKVCLNDDCPDMKVFGIRGEYYDDMTTCPKCGFALGPQGDGTIRETSIGVEFRDLVPLCSPGTSSELAIIESLLRSEDVFFFVHNNYFGGMKVGLPIPLFNQRTILVSREDLERALDILEPPHDFKPIDPSPSKFADRIRMFIEVAVFGWIIPNQRHPYVNEHDA